MGLHGYGLLIGRVAGSRPPRKGSPHWVLFIQPGDPKHPRYRVAVNFQTPQPRQKAEAQYQIVRFGAKGPGGKLIAQIRALGEPEAFLTADSKPDLPRLDFVRGGFLDPRRFRDLDASDKSLQRQFRQAVRDASAKDSELLVAVFGTGRPVDKSTGKVVPTGYTGVENIHMNQGAMNLINHPPHYRENAVGQDGGIIFLSKNAATGFFTKFTTQTISTRHDGHPAVTGVPEIDGVSAAIRKAITPKLPLPSPRSMAMAVHARTPSGRIAATAAGPSTANGAGFIFADVNPDDASGEYQADADDNYQTPFVQDRGKLKIKGPVPTPLAYPTMQLSGIVGGAPPGYSKTAQGEEIAFDIVGDSGAPSAAKFKGETGVAELMSSLAQSAPPAFLFHVGDVVYFYGEENYYYSQFYEPFRAYPAPIFAIPGNHDGITYNDTMVSLSSFQQAFCAPESGLRWDGNGGILRSRMTQPGVYFTLDAPLVSIIGLYSNIGESFGWLDEPQLVFLYKELVRLKAARAGDGRAVILAIHHFPRWFPAQKKDPNSTAVDAVCTKAGFWPDAVICGHAHLYQRVIRPNGDQDIPYVMSGAGGYGISAMEELGKNYMKDTVGSNVRLGKVLFEEGFVRASVSKPVRGDAKLTFQYHSVKQPSGPPSDSCVLNLRTRKVE